MRPSLRTVLLLGPLLASNACTTDCGERSGADAATGARSEPADTELFAANTYATHLTRCGDSLCWVDVAATRSSGVLAMPSTGGARRTLWSGGPLRTLSAVHDGVWALTYEDKLRYLPLTLGDAASPVFPLSRSPWMAVDEDTLWLVEPDTLFKAAPGEAPRVVRSLSGGGKVAAAAGSVVWLETPPPQPEDGDATVERYRAQGRAPVSALMRLRSSDGVSNVVATGLVAEGLELATDGTFAYLMSGPSEHRHIARIPLAGGAPETLVEMGRAMTLGLIGETLYWFEARESGKMWDSIVRMSKAGGATERFVREPRIAASFTVSDGTYVYWASSDGIRRKRQ